MKDLINDAAEISKAVIKELIDENNKNIQSAVDNNKMMVDSIREKLRLRKMNDSVTTELINMFVHSVELAENSLGIIINSFQTQMSLNADLNTRLINVLCNSKSDSKIKLMNLISENFAASHNLIIRNTREINIFYTNQTNLALHFNNRFGENVCAQIENLFNIKKNSLKRIKEWASKGWQ